LNGDGPITNHNSLFVLPMVAIRTLPTSFNLPKIGLGTLGISPSEARSTINESLSLGYRCFDAAPVYFNEKDIGDAFHESTSPVVSERCNSYVTKKRSAFTFGANISCFSPNAASY
jgi:diketogulonate reductase-like aldo/keto reductase